MQHILAGIAPVWLIDDLGASRLNAAGALVSARSAGEERPGLFTAATQPVRQSGKIAVVPVHGMLDQRRSELLDWLGGTATEDVAAAVEAAASDSSVRAVVLEIDSPGGSSFGVGEAAERIRAAAERKPVIAVANSYAASAAYWLASAADRIYATPGGYVGSIGVYLTHVDASQAMADAGYKVSLVKAGRYKAEGLPSEPMTSEFRDHLQGIVNQTYDRFVSSVAKGRGVTENAVIKQYGEGRTLSAADAKARGMIDGVKTFEQVLGTLVKHAGGTGPKSEGGELLACVIDELEAEQRAADERKDMELKLALRERKIFCTSS